jgi:hypothetical protein
MDLPTFERLRTAEGEEALARAADLALTEATLLNCLTRLRRDFSHELARAALETVRLRRWAAG